MRDDECRPPKGTPPDGTEVYSIWNLTPEQSAAFLRGLLNPPEPNDVLKAAAARYKRRIATPPCGNHELQSAACHRHKTGTASMKCTIADCQADGPWMKTEAAAIAAWNRRAGEDKP
jgi:hypothetical protein